MVMNEWIAGPARGVGLLAVVVHLQQLLPKGLFDIVRLAG